MYKNEQQRLYFERIALKTNMEIEAEYYLLFYCENVFTGTFFLQLQWNHSVVEWRRNILQPPIKEEEGTFDFTLCYEKGFFVRESIPKLWRMLKNLNVKVLPQRESGEGRDGSIIELSIGTSDTCSTFYWYTCKTEPDWKSLDDIEDFLYELNKSLKGEEKEYYQVSFLKEVKKM